MGPGSGPSERTARPSAVNCRAMAVRSASRTYPTVRAFLEDWRSTLRLGALTLPPGAVVGEPAPNMKVDLIVPLAGRLGPIDAQVIQQMPDGTVALRVPEWPPVALTGFQAVFDAVEELKQHLLAVGEVVVPNPAVEAEIAALRSRVRELESRPAVVAHVAPAGGGDRGAPGAPRKMVDEEGNLVVERGYPIPDLTDVPPTLSGQIGDRSLRDAMMELALERVTGLLTLQLPDGRVRWGFWQKGGPVAWRAEPIVEDEVLGILMFRASQLTREQLEQSLDLMERNGIRQGEALIELGVITFAQVVLLLQKQTEFVFQRVIRERAGTWTFHLLDELPERFVAPPLRVPSLLFRSLRTYAKDMPAEDLATSLRPWLDKYVYFIDGAQRLLDEMKTNTDETGFFKIVQATSYRLRELFAVSNLPRSATAGMIWTLADLRLIEFRDEEADARGVQRLVRVLDDRRRAVTKGTLFEALDLHWICTAPDVEAAWKRLAPEYGPEGAAKWGAENRKAVDGIYEHLRGAYERLRQDKARRDYRASIMEKMQIEQSAEMLAKKGDMAVMKENARESLDCFSKACELAPNVPEYQAGLTRARAMRQ